MIDCIFTIDYEIYGNGGGSLHDLIYSPAEKLISTFQKYNKLFVVFVEVAELEMIELEGTDKSIDLVNRQLRSMHESGFELGLHIHPGWYHSKYDSQGWHIDYDEYNLSSLPKRRINEILERAVSYLKRLLNKNEFSPVSFRSGHLLFQPTNDLACALSEIGIKVDSSLYKGGLWYQQNQDYRKSRHNGYYWRFKKDINKPDPDGVLLELPIYTQMVPPWKMVTSKRVGLQGSNGSVKQTGRRIFSRMTDYMRLTYPLKFDIGQMTTEEILKMMAGIIKIDEHNPSTYKPIVIIGHTKELDDMRSIEALLSYLEKHHIAVSTLAQAYHRCI